MLQRVLRKGAFVAGLLLSFVLPARAEEAQPCPAARLSAISLPHLKRALTANQDVTIVALGSSSTAGSHASDVAHTYPAILQRELERALPTSHIAVLNRGVGGQDATEMLARLEKDTLALSPTVVIWQVGANGAMRGMDPELFKRLVGSGVKRLEAAGVDVILMDNQRAPVILASAQHARIDQALADVAAHQGAGLFARGQLMDLWQQEGSPYSEFISDDGVHHNDHGYACVAKALAATILDGLRPQPAVRTAQSVRATRAESGSISP
ncbi:MAG: SGNH/GDSL hydrolase family protein [Acetobacteraceae bacterium]|nr:SGNH/GDSL hydrolase family protein [Acetobacteraceae bacterium]